MNRTGKLGMVSHAPLDPAAVLRAMVHFSVAGVISGVPVNVSSITDTGTGDWTVNFISKFAVDKLYAHPGIQHAVAAGSSIGFKQSAAMGASVSITTGNPTGARVDPTNVYLVAWGE